MVIGTWHEVIHDTWHMIKTIRAWLKTTKSVQHYLNIHKRSSDRIACMASRILALNSGMGRLEWRIAIWLYIWAARYTKRLLPWLFLARGKVRQRDCLVLRHTCSWLYDNQKHNMSGFPLVRMPCKSERSKYVIMSDAGSHARSLRTSQMWSNFLLPEITLAEKFSTFCSLVGFVRLALP